MGALTKGWGLFSSAVAAAGSTINESVIQPGMKRAETTVGEFNERGLSQMGEQYGQQGQDFTQRLSEQAKSTGGWLSSLAGEGWARANQLAKEHAARGGDPDDADFARNLEHLKLNGPSKYQGYEGYGRVEADDGGVGDDGWGFKDDPEEDKPPVTTETTVKQDKKKEIPSKQDGIDDEWKDF